MSLYDFKRARELQQADEPFAALIMAAILRADTSNGVTLRLAFPQIADEVAARYKAGGGILPGEPDYERIQRARADIGMPPS